MMQRGSDAPEPERHRPSATRSTFPESSEEADGSDLLNGQGLVRGGWGVQNKEHDHLDLDCRRLCRSFIDI